MERSPARRVNHVRPAGLLLLEANLKACLAPSSAAGEVFNIAYGGHEYLLDIYYGLTKALGVDV